MTMNKRVKALCKFFPQDLLHARHLRLQEDKLPLRTSFVLAVDKPYMYSYFPTLHLCYLRSRLWGQKRVSLGLDSVGIVPEPIVLLGVLV